MKDSREHTRLTNSVRHGKCWRHPRAAGLGRESGDQFGGHFVVLLVGHQQGTFSAFARPDDAALAFSTRPFPSIEKLSTTSQSRKDPTVIHLPNTIGVSRIELGVPLAGLSLRALARRTRGRTLPEAVNTNALDSIVAGVKGSFRIALTKDRAVWNSLSRLHCCKIPS